MSYLNYDQLPDPSGKFELGEELGTGFSATVYKAKDLQNDQWVAIKIQPYDEEHQVQIEEEFRVLRDHSSYPNLPDFYGVYRKPNNNAPDDIWFILQYCTGGTAVELVNKLLQQDRRMKEEHISFILKEVVKAAVEIHRNHNIHRDIRGSNILLTKEGEVKLCDFGLTREVDSTFGKRGTCVGSPSWMAPELVTAVDANSNEVYTSRIDVWALGITAIELADGKPPFADMHPTRALFQIVRNPPPTLFKPSNWTQNFIDFIAECLEKNPENRPCMIEIIEHPFLTELTQSEYVLQQEIKHFIEMSSSEIYYKPEEVCVDRGFMKCFNRKPEKLYSEDLAAIENPVDAVILEHLGNRLKSGNSYSFIGDVLLSLNSNDLPLNYSDEFHQKYRFKSRSENSPHIFSVADVAYQDMMHHKVPQHVIFSGESYSGKTANFRLFTKHIFFLGGGNRGATDRVDRAIKTISSLTNAGTPLNNDSTRCFLQYTFTFGNTGKLSGAVFQMYLLEKMRVSSTDMNQHNFHLFYYFYDYMAANSQLAEFHLNEGRSYRYLRAPPDISITKLKYVRDSPNENVAKFREFEENLVDMDFSRQHIDLIRKILAAILNIGDLRFRQSELKKTAEIEDLDIVSRIAELLRVDEKKFQWSLVNYCKVMGGIAERRQYSPEEARDARDCLAATLYNRLVDWIINRINMNLAFPRTVFGDAFSIVVYDMFGFECFHRNGYEQLMINTVNEEMQFLYNQKIFASEMFEQESDGIPPVQLNYYDNKQTLDNMLTKPDGLFYIIDDASRQRYDPERLTERVTEKRSQFIKKHTANEISVAHYTGKIIYDIRAFADVNRDFVPAEMIESLRTSLDENIVLMFSNQLTKCGNLTLKFENVQHKSDDKKKKSYAVNTLSMGQYNQVTQPRSLSAIFRATCLEILKILSGENEKSGSHFVRCIRADLDYQPRNFHAEMVQQQLKALGVIDTIIARQQGYSCRITFREFLNRYQFLAFDFDETVDITKDNSRLLLIRLKMEGWAIGKSKVFLRYYNDEFLSRLYETQVKKIIKVQSMMRSYIARRKMQQKNNPAGKSLAAQVTQDPAAAAVKIQKAYRGYKVRQKYGPLLNEKTGEIDQNTAGFLRSFAKRWKAKSIFQVLLYYRAAKFQDLVNLSQQVHIYNQRFVSLIHQYNKPISLEKVNTKQTNSSHLGPLPLPCRKLPFRLIDVPFYDTSYMCDPISGITSSAAAIKGKEDEEAWDSPLQRNPSLTNYLMTYNAYKREQACQTNWDRMHESDVVYQQNYNRDPIVMRRNAILRQQNEFYTSDPSASAQSKHRRDSYGRPYENGYQMDYPNNYNQGHGGSGSRRNSLYKKRMAPTPPPTPGMRNDASWASRQPKRDNIVKSDFRPANPVRELEMLGRRGGDMNNDTGDEPPFNFKAMLRKTNYSRPENNNYEYNSNSFAPKLKPTGYSRSGDRNDSNYNSSSNNYNTPSSNLSNSNVSSFREAGTYVEEEIAPGVTLTGYAIDI